MKFLALCAILVSGLCIGTRASAADLRDVFGVAHVDGKYFLTNGDYLNEGADQVLATGSRVIKLYLTPVRYPWNSTWPTNVKSLAEMAQTPYFRTAFAKPFSTIILTAYSIGRKDHYWTTEITPADEADETRQFHDLSKYLLTTYKGSGKTFVLQHWEGDWALRDLDGHTYQKEFTPPQTSIDGMIKWLNARQAGIRQAREEVTDTDVHVYGACESNRVADAIAGKPSVALSVLPNTTVDLASYSSWDTQDDETKLGEAIDFLASHLPKTAAFGQNTHSVYIGEFGAPENGRGAQRVIQNIRNAQHVVSAKGLPWAIYWEIYCNELKDESQAPPVNGNNNAVRGFWMIKPDGTRGAAWQCYQEMFK